MKISCTQENLNQGLFVVSHIATKNVALPILNNILFQVKENTIKLSATNLEIGISCVVRGKVETEGEFTIQSRLLADYVGLLPRERVDIESLEGDQVYIECKNYSTKIKTQPSLDFPLIPGIERIKPYTVKAEDFRKAISQVIFAVSQSETRPEIGGVLFNFNNSKLTLAATDSYRLAQRSLAFQGGAGSARRVIVPTKTLQEISRILGSFKDPAAISNIDDVSLYIADNQILFVLDSVELVSRLVEGQYPDYEQIIPQQTKTAGVIEAGELTKAIKAASLFARSGIYDVNLEFRPDEKNLVVSSTNNQLGENSATVAADIKGGENKIVLNFRYLLDGMQGVNSEQVELAVIDANSPCVLRPASKDSEYVYIIMPIKQ